jgi:formyltetrahydrofolate deformylase
VRRIRLLIACADRPGIVAAVSAFLFENGANIVDSAQHLDGRRGRNVLLRTEFDLGGAGANA